MGRRNPTDGRGDTDHRLRQGRRCQTQDSARRSERNGRGNLDRCNDRHGRDLPDPAHARAVAALLLPRLRGPRSQDQRSRITPRRTARGEFDQPRRCGGGRLRHPAKGRRALLDQYDRIERTHARTRFDNLGSPDRQNCRSEQPQHRRHARILGKHPDPKPRHPALRHRRSRERRRTLQPARTDRHRIDIGHQGRSRSHLRRAKPPTAWCSYRPNAAKTPEAGSRSA